MLNWYSNLSDVKASCAALLAAIMVVSLSIVLVNVVHGPQPPVPFDPLDRCLRAGTPIAQSEMCAEVARRN